MGPNSNPFLLPHSPPLSPKQKSSQGQRQTVSVCSAEKWRAPHSVDTINLLKLSTALKFTGKCEPGLIDQVLCKFNHEKDLNIYLINVEFQSSSKNTSFHKGLALQMIKCNLFSTKPFFPEPQKPMLVHVKMYIVTYKTTVKYFQHRSHTSQAPSPANAFSFHLSLQ